MTIGKVEEMFGSVVSEAVDAITQRDGEEYEKYLERCSRNPIAKRVKIAEERDNLLRLNTLPDAKDQERAWARCMATWRALGGSIDTRSGETARREEAVR